MAIKKSFRTYYLLAKPGIVYGNALIASAAFFLGAYGSPDLTVFFAMFIGICAVMASACVFNNILDRDIDRKMKRTRKRAMVSGSVSTRQALVYGTVLLALGLVVLLLGTNMLSTLVAITGHIAYVVLYGYAKRTTVHGTLVGTISGSTPPVIGYTAATGQLDVTALLLFLILVAWQMPHFYAIAIFRRDDYAAANIPVLPVVKGIRTTRRQILIYVLLFLLAVSTLWVWTNVSLLGTLVVLLAGLYWLYLCLQSVNDDDINGWASRQFVWSLKLLLILSLTWSLDSFLH
jgi:protoheme IX farnesyltransferase